MQGTYLMNGYLVFNVHAGINPTLTYRTVLAQKRNTHFEKIKKIFSEEQKKPADRSQRASLHPNIHFSTLKKGKKIRGPRLCSRRPLLSTYGTQ